MTAEPEKKLTVLSFDTGLAISGITAWNVRTATALSTMEECGVEWTAVEVASPKNRQDIARNIPPECEERVMFLQRHQDVNSWRSVRGWYESIPGWKDIDVVLPNGVMEGWILPELIQQRTGRRPAVIGGIHNDMDIAYSMSGEGTTGCDAVFAVSKHCQAEYRRRYPNLGVPEYVSYGVPVGNADREMSAGRPLQLLYCGRLATYQKRCMDLVKLVEQLKARKISFQMHIVGDGEDRSRLEAGMKGIGAGEVVFYGALQGEQVFARYRESDILISVSEFEGTSISMLEGMGQGVAPVVTDIASGVRDVIVPGESGFVAAIGDMAGMAEIIGNLDRDREMMMRTAAAARERIRTGYSVEASARRFAALVRRTVATMPQQDYRVLPGHPILRERPMDRRWVPRWMAWGYRKARSGARHMLKGQ